MKIGCDGPDFSMLWRTAIVALLMVWLGAVQANSADCANPQVHFDGVKPLTYAVVNRGSGESLPIHPVHPSKCSSPNEQACKGKAYILPGDAVAIGAQCGAWDYVQYIGAKRITVGWVESQRLVKRSSQTKREQSRRKEAVTSESEMDVDKSVYHFELKKGGGTPVCEALLQRLNQTHYEAPPYCDIPEDSTVPGFEALQRKTPSERLERQMFYHAEVFASTGGSGQDYTTTAEAYMYDRRYTGAGSPFSKVVWLYGSPLDMENNGHPRHILVWQGLGHLPGPCGTRVSPGSDNYSRVAQQAFVLSDNTGRIDENETRAVFYRPRERSKVVGDVYTPIGLTTSIFKYGGTYYFGGFYDAYSGLDGDFNGERKWKNNRETTFSSGLGNTFDLFLRKDRKTSLVCDYVMTIN